MSKQITTFNVSQFFNREMILYALGDWKFKSPLPLKQVAITIAFGLALTGIFWVSGIFDFNVYIVTLIALPSWALGKYAPQPIWNGRSLFKFLVVQTKFLMSDKIFADLKGSKSSAVRIYTTFTSIWVSRRKEYKKLAKNKKHEEG